MCLLLSAINIFFLNIHSVFFCVCFSRCPTLIGQQIASEQAVVTDADGKPGRSITLEMFKFPGSNRVGITAKMAVCDTVDDAKCKAVSLDALSHR